MKMIFTTSLAFGVGIIYLLGMFVTLDPLWGLQSDTNRFLLVTLGTIAGMAIAGGRIAAQEERENDKTSE